MCASGDKKVAQLTCGMSCFGCMNCFGSVLVLANHSVEGAVMVMNFMLHIGEEKFYL